MTIDSTKVQDTNATPDNDKGDCEKKSFAETALTLGGKSAEEAKRTGAIDKADDQVEALFAPQYQTNASPAHRAVWDNQIPVEFFISKKPTAPPHVQKVMDDSLAVARRHREADTILDKHHKVSNQVLS